MYICPKIRAQYDNDISHVLKKSGINLIYFVKVKEKRDFLVLFCFGRWIFVTPICYEVIFTTKVPNLNKDFKLQTSLNYII